MNSMLRTKLMLLSVCVLSMNASSQDATLDSLKLALKNAKHDTVRCSILNTLAETAEENEWQKYNEELVVLSKKNSAVQSILKNVYLRYYANALNNKGINEYNQGNFLKAIDFHLQSFKINEQIKNQLGLAACYTNLGQSYYYLGDISKSLAYAQKSLKMYEALNEIIGMSTCLNNIGQIYLIQGDVLKSIECFNKCIVLDKQIGNENGIAMSLSNLGQIYFKQGDIKKALDYNH